MEPIRYISLFSGIEAATVAWHPLGWQPVAFSEVDKFCCELLKHYYPEVPNLGDVTKITREQIEALGHVDVVVFGSPCTDMSIAGKREGLKDGTRSSLFFQGVEVARWSKARFTLWENVPGAFSSNHGDDFGAVVGSLVGVAGVPVPHCRWRNEGVAVGPLGMAEWAVLDAEFFGVVQRRRRVFALLDTGDWASRPPVLLEPHRLRGDPPTRGEAGEGVAPPIAGCSNGGGANGPGRTVDDAEALVPVTRPLGSSDGTRGWRSDLDHGALVPEVVPALTSKMAKGTGGPAGDECQNLIAFDPTQVTHPENRSNPQPGAPCHTLAKGQGAPCVAMSMAIRRLTPEECCALQGFPRGYTQIPRGPKGKPTADGPRYRAIGNSMAVNVMYWIGRRIAAVLEGDPR